MVSPPSRGSCLLLSPIVPLLLLILGPPMLGLGLMRDLCGTWVGPMLVQVGLLGAMLGPCCWCWYIPVGFTIYCPFCFSSPNSVLQRVLRSCLPLSPHMCTFVGRCARLLEVLSPRVSQCLPTCVPLFDGVTAFPRPCLPLVSSRLSPGLSRSLDGASAFPRPCPLCLPACFPACLLTFPQPVSQLVSLPLVYQLVLLLVSSCSSFPNFSPSMSPSLSSFLFALRGWCVHLAKALAPLSRSLSPSWGPTLFPSLSPACLPACPALVSQLVSQLVLSSFLFSSVGLCAHLPEALSPLSRSLSSHLLSQLCLLPCFPLLDGVPTLPIPCRHCLPACLPACPQLVSQLFSRLVFLLVCLCWMVFLSPILSSRLSPSVFQLVSQRVACFFLLSLCGGWSHFAFLVDSEQILNAHF